MKKFQELIPERYKQVPEGVWFAIFLISTTIAIGVFSTFSGGGYDAYVVFFSGELHTVPPWVHLLLTPISWIRWPYSYMMMSMISWATIMVSTRYLGGKWWWVSFSLPCVWEIWSGQIEWMIILGMILAVYLIRNEGWPGWFGISWVLLMVKPWMGVTIVGLTAYWIWNQYGIKKILYPGLVTICIVGATFAYKPDWLRTWMVPFFENNLWQFSTEVRQSDLIPHPAMQNGALWPWGILSWGLVFGFKSEVQGMKRVYAATLLSVPYLRFYHTLPLLVFIENEKHARGIFLVGWMVLATVFLGIEWARFAWIIPALVLLLDRYFTQEEEKGSGSLIG